MSTRIELINENITLTGAPLRFDLEDAFSRIGRVRDVWVARKPPGFAFIEMEVSRNWARFVFQN